MKLGSITKIRTGKLDANAASDDGQYPFFTCSQDILRISTYSYDCECVLVAGNGDLNVKYYNGKFDAYQRTYIIENNFDSNLSMRYLYYFLKRYVHTLRRQSIGGVIKYIKLENLTEVDLPLPNISIQNEIVEKLDRINELIIKRNQQLAKLDTLVKSRFIEMFGDININEKSWATERMEDICDSIGDGLHGTPKYDDKGRIPFINGNNLNGRIIHTSTTKYVGDDEYSRLFIHLSNNAILLSINGTLGNLAYYNNEKVCLGKSAAYFNVKQDYNRTFVYELMRTEHFQQYLESNSTKSTIKNVGLKTLRDYRIITPPITLQNQFADFVTQADKSKLAIRKLLEKQELLRAALMQEYFG